jgi:putative endonuclease
MNGGFVYIMSNQYRGTIYIGVTSDLVQRVWQHKEKLIKGFTKKYHLTRLVWFESHDSIISAIEAEKKLKNIYRSKKIALIEKANPLWHDMYPEITEERSCAAALQPAG